MDATAKTTKQLLKWVKILQNALNLTTSKKVIRGQCPQITSDDFDTWQAIADEIDDAELESGIHFPLNNRLEAQTRNKKKILETTKFT